MASLMKKIIIRSLIVLVVLIIVAVVAVGFFLDSIVKKGVETVGPEIAKVDVKLNSVSLSLLSGSGTIKGLVVGNPAGYKSPQAISVGAASVSVSPGSVFSDKVVVRSIRVESPEITFEGGLTKNNLNTILDNVDAASGGGAESGGTKEEAATSKKLQVDDFLVTGAKVHVGAGALTLDLPDIHLSGLGTGPEGITAGDLTKRVLSDVVNGALKEVAARGASAISKAAMDAGSKAEEEATKQATEGVEKVGKSIGDLFKKKD